METAIFSAIVRAMNDFHDKTGMSPQSIHVQLHDVSRIGDGESRFDVFNVSATVAL